MKCPACGLPDTKVVDSRPAEDGTLLRRRRQCERCGNRFTTHERVMHVPLIITKKDGRREAFASEKLRAGVLKACNKRLVSIDQVENLIGDVEATLRHEPGNEVASERVGELVMERLYNLDQVAYVRFASVYQRFDDVKRFAQILERISRRNRNREKNDADALVAEKQVATPPGAKTSVVKAPRP